MGNRRIYPNAPITEAIIGLDAQLPAGVTAELLQECGNRLKGDYPNRHDLIVAQGKIEFGDAVNVATAREKVGYQYSSVDQKYVFLVRLNGFSLHRLAPYEGWEPFISEARRIWSIYHDIVAPVRLIRVSVRYINRLDLPAAAINLQEYLRTSLEVSPELEGRVSTFFMQMQIPQTRIGGVLVLNEALVPSVRPDVVSVVLDLDLSRIEGLPDPGSDLWALLEEMHDCKNDIFEACITDKTRELIL